MDATIHPWWEGELAGCVFVDQRLGQRLRKLIERMAGAIGASLPLACQGKRMKVCNPIAEAFRGGHRCGNPVEPSNRRGLMAECRPILGIDRLHAFALACVPRL